MFKKLLVVLLSLLLVSCGDSQIETIENDEYISPATDVFLFGELDANTQVLIKKANGNKNYSNFQFKMLGKQVYQDNLIDIYGNVIDLSSYKQVVVEAVSVECAHCKKLISEHLNDFLSYDIPFIQYFDIGDSQEIIDYYAELGIEIADNMIIVGHDDKMHDYISDDLDIESYPSLLSYVDGSLTFMGDGTYDSETIEDFYNISFVEPLNNLTNIYGNDLLSLLRGVDDVKESLSIENQNKIAELDNDQSTASATYKLMGTTCDYDYITNDKSDVYINEIDDFSIYKDKDVVLFYVFLRDETETSKVEFINSLVASNDNYEYIAVLIEGLESSSNAYNNMSIKFSCPCVSVLGYMPNDFYKIGLTAYPSALFIRKGTFTGAYSNVENIDKFNDALDIFLSDNCVALTRNN